MAPATPNTRHLLARIPAVFYICLAIAIGPLAAAAQTELDQSKSSAGVGELNETEGLIPISEVDFKLFESISRYDISGVAAALDVGADPNARYVDGTPALVYASLQDSSEIVQALLLRGADPKASTADGITAITAGVLADNHKIVRSLLEAGLDPDYSLPGLPRPIFLAIGEGADASLDILLESGAHPYRLPPEDLSPFSYAERLEQQYAARRLREIDLSVECQSLKGFSLIFRYMGWCAYVASKDLFYDNDWYTPSAVRVVKCSVFCIELGLDFYSGKRVLNAPSEFVADANALSDAFWPEDWVAWSDIYLENLSRQDGPLSAFRQILVSPDCEGVKVITDESLQMNELWGAQSVNLFFKESDEELKDFPAADCLRNAEQLEISLATDHGILHDSIVLDYAAEAARSALRHFLAEIENFRRIKREIIEGDRSCVQRHVNNRGVQYELTQRCVNATHTLVADQFIEMRR